LHGLRRVVAVVVDLVDDLPAVDPALAVGLSGVDVRSTGIALEIVAYGTELSRGRHRS
jgi:hypothetical protein